MSFLLIFLIVFGTTTTIAMLSVRKFFMKSYAAGYVFVVINWVLLLIVTLVFALIIKAIESFFSGA